MEIPNSGSPPVNGLVEKAEKLQVSIALGKGKKQKKESLSAKQQRSKSSCHFDSFIAARTRLAYRSLVRRPRVVILWPQVRAGEGGSLVDAHFSCQLSVVQSTRIAK